MLLARKHWYPKFLPKTKVNTLKVFSWKFYVSDLMNGTLVFKCVYNDKLKVIDRKEAENLLDAKSIVTWLATQGYELTEIRRELLTFVQK